MQDDKQTILVATFKHYIICKIMEVYGYCLKDNLPNNHISNKSDEVIKACKKFYDAFDKKIKLDGVKAIDDMLVEYFTTVDVILSLKPDNFAIIAEHVKKLMEKETQEKEVQELKPNQMEKRFLSTGKDPYYEDFLKESGRSGLNVD